MWPCLWGSHYWDVLHYITLCIPRRDITEMVCIEFLNKFIESTFRILPCPGCKYHALLWLRTHPLNQIRTWDDAYVYLFDLHNDVTERNRNVPCISVKVARDLTIDVIKDWSHSKRITQVNEVNIEDDKHTTHSEMVYDTDRDSDGDGDGDVGDDDGKMSRSNSRDLFQQLNLSKVYHIEMLYILFYACHVYTFESVSVPHREQQILRTIVVSFIQVAPFLNGEYKESSSDDSMVTNRQYILDQYMTTEDPFDANNKDDVIAWIFRLANKIGQLVDHAYSHPPLSHKQHMDLFMSNFDSITINKKITLYKTNLANQKRIADLESRLNITQSDTTQSPSTLSNQTAQDGDTNTSENIKTSAVTQMKHNDNTQNNNELHEDHITENNNEHIFLFIGIGVIITIIMVYIVFRLRVSIHDIQNRNLKMSKELDT